MLTLINLIVYVFCESRLLPPTFKKRNDSYTAFLSLGEYRDVRSYGIMEGELDAKESDFTIVHTFSDQTGNIDSIEVSLDEIGTINPDLQYSISVTTDEETLYSEPFRYCTKEKNFKLVRRFKNDPWYIKYKFVLGGALIGVLIGVGVVFVKRYVKNKEEDTL